MNTAAPERSTTPTDKLSGVIERVAFFNEESGFCVLRIKAPGHREEVTVIGSLPSVSAGEWLSAEGWWVRDREHGLQFKASTIGRCLRRRSKESSDISAAAWSMA